MPKSKCPKRTASGKNGKWVCWANLAKIQPKNHQNVQNMYFLQKSPGVNGLKLDNVKRIHGAVFEL